MKSQNVKIYCELMENCNECARLLILSQLAIDDGDLPLSQKYFLQVKDILSTLVKDTFEEVKRLYNSNIFDNDDYDISTLNLACILNKICKSASILVDMEYNNQSETIKNSILYQLIKTLNACIELYEALFN